MSKPTFRSITARLADRPTERKRSKQLSAEHIEYTHYTSEELADAYVYQKAILNQQCEYQTDHGEAEQASTITTQEQSCQQQTKKQTKQQRMKYRKWLAWYRQHKQHQRAQREACGK